MNTTMYDKLLKLPLFQGLSRNDLTVILEKVKVEFRSYIPEEYIVQQNDACTELIFILDGNVVAYTTDSTYKFTICEDICCETLIEPYSLFGIRPLYNATYQARSLTNVLVIKKNYILPLLSKYDIFNLNYFNLLSGRVQNLQSKLWNTHIGSTWERIVNFLSLRCTTITGAKEITITMEDLASLLNDTRINISRALNKMQDLGYVQLSRKVIKINNLDDLIQEVQKQPNLKNKYNVT